MYKYDEYDQRIVDERVAQFRDQTRRYLAGELSEDEFKPLRLQNGLYIQRYAPMLRVAVPYGLLNSTQIRKLAHIARTWDKGYAHVSTRQNFQYNWPELKNVPDILAELATVEMHAIQTSGNCIRNVTTDQFAGIAPDEVVDPRPLAEIIRQWSTFHPEFALLPRKFKFAVSGSSNDRAVVQMHDIGLEFYRDGSGELLIKVWVGGGLGRTPILGEVIEAALPWQHLLTYADAIIRVYNRHGRRDNIYKARIKILVKALGIEEFKRQVEAEWAHHKDGPNTITQAEFDRVAKFFTAPAYETLTDRDAGIDAKAAEEKAFANWLKRNVHAHKVAGYRAVTLSLKPTGIAPGDISDKQLEVVADLADKYSYGELRTTHEQNIVLSDVKLGDLYALWQEARAAGLATPNIGLITDIICCPGGDFCDLANAKSIPIAASIQQLFDDLDYQHDIGELELNISGCMNSCGHHHVGHIGVLGVDKGDSEWYQVSIGGKQGNDASLGAVIGPSFAADEVAGVVKRLIDVYLENRSVDERFIDTVRRLGHTPFKERVYADRQPGKQKVEA
ncbi:nitrite/sulfite reductase [Uliginosibacterium aquaticum]|uniref:Nitrite/sulfite reductase n=1 Tax=Uliginosibacterium aquaticum TaxID=2731212 RepID=A0ABX2II92_9RHOO|nr:nitrite/sulfite reductase [Uliginosibacterium aquaticum]NSL56002.1 nitrite/sulfite reductase [Uliginosibacterium aquaticum]